MNVLLGIYKAEKSSCWKGKMKLRKKVRFGSKRNYFMPD
jgi:hypothetical protein